MRAREEVDEHFDQRMDFAIAAGHYCGTHDMTNYFFARAAAVLGKKKSSFAIKQWNFYCKCIVHKNPSVANIHAANTNTNTSTITNTKQKYKYKYMDISALFVQLQIPNKNTNTNTWIYLRYLYSIL